MPGSPPGLATEPMSSRRVGCAFRDRWKRSTTTTRSGGSISACRCVSHRGFESELPPILSLHCILQMRILREEFPIMLYARGFPRHWVEPYLAGSDRSDML